MLLFILILSGLVMCNSGYSIGSDTNSLFKCSSFHYEEKVLEKLVRLEHKMEMYSDKIEKLETELRTTGESTEITDFIRNIKERFDKENQTLHETLLSFIGSTNNKTETQNVVMETMKEAVKLQIRDLNDTVQASLVGLSNQLVAKTEAVQTFIDNVNKKLDKMDTMQINMEGRLNKTVENMEDRMYDALEEMLIKHQTNGTVAFTACNEMNKRMKKDEPIIFPSIVTSFGVQNLSSLATIGEFRTESPGLYLITLTVMVRTFGTNFKVYRNSIHHLLDVYVSDVYRLQRSSSGSVVLFLDRDDQITVKPDKSVYSYFSLYSRTVALPKATCLTIVKI